MIRFSDLRIRTKLRVLSLIAILSLILLGFISNYFFRTSKVLGIIINAERVHNNTFQEGIEDFYRFHVSNDLRWIDSAQVKLETANQMAKNFGIIDQLMKLPEEEGVRIMYGVYKESYNFEMANAYLMVNRLKLFLVLKPQKLVEAQQVAKNGYELGEKIKSEIQLSRTQSGDGIDDVIHSDLTEMRNFYSEFALSITSLINYTNSLLLIGMLLIVLLLVFIVATISAIISKSIGDPVQEMVEKFGVIAKGNLKTELTHKSGNEIGKLASSFREIQKNLLEVIEYTKKVAKGDYSKKITPRSEEDEMSVALNIMVEQLKESHDQAEQESWFRSGINQINEKLQGTQDLSALSKNALSFMTEFLHSQLGSIHFYNADHQFLKLISSVGFDPKKLNERVRLNEGLIGQVAEKKQVMVLDHIPDESYVTFSSSGEFRPKQIIITPLIFNENLVGVLELASLQVFTPIELRFIQIASEIIAINLNSAESVLKTKELLQKTQDQASELQVQQEELRVANEELVEHTKVLTENEKRLQVQQEELRVANEELEERTRQLEIQKDEISHSNMELTELQKKMEIKAKELQMASQYKSEFLANMSHELRTPLNSLLILSKLLSGNKKGNLTEDQVQSAQIIHKSGNDLLGLINEVLDLSKIEAGKMNIDKGNVETMDIKDEILMNFKATAEDKNLALNVFVDPGFPKMLHTDRQRLMQIIRNLLSNAFKFTSSGNVSVGFVRTGENVKFNNAGLNHTNTCCVKVSDTGVGIPEEKLDAIFEAFQQADGSISRKYGGTGLGLSISKELIRMLGGEIKLESKLNEGSTFYLYLPVQSNSVSEVPVEIKVDSPVLEKEILPSEPIIEETPASFVDDDRNNSSLERVVLIVHHSKLQAEKLLQQAKAKGYQVVVASNIHDGIVLAEKFRPKAIMLDVELASGNNSEYQKLKANERVNKLPVHLITPIDYSEANDQEELKTLETVEFGDALKLLENHLISDSKRILIIEDNVVTLKVTRQLLSGVGVELEEATLAEEAYKRLVNEKFDCIILDLGLPDYSGNELLEKLKANHIYIPKVIIYTGKEMTKDEIKGLNHYTDTIILKGIKSDERLMDEVTLFLHQVSKTFAEPKAKAFSPDANDLFKGKRILVVDDEIRNVFALGKILEEREMEVLEAENGQVAIDILKENKQIDLVLMDVMMPVMNGYEAMQVIRSTPEIKDIPIICLTAKAMKEDHENALKNGANDYLSKPLNEEKLFAMLKIWLYRN